MNTGDNVKLLRDVDVVTTDAEGREETFLVREGTIGTLVSIEGEDRGATVNYTKRGFILSKAKEDEIPGIALVDIKITEGKKPVCALIKVSDLSEEEVV